MQVASGDGEELAAECHGGGAGVEGRPGAAHGQGHAQALSSAVPDPLQSWHIYHCYIIIYDT